MGLCCPILQILTLFQTKKCYFPHPFSDQISKLHTHFRTWPSLACSRLSDSWETPQFSPLLFSVRAFSIQWTQLPFLGAWNRLDLIGRNYVIITKLERKQKNSPNAFRIRIFIFYSYSFGIETINTSIHVRSCSSLENHTRFQTKMGKVFSDQKGPKTLPFGWYIPIWLI